MQVAGLLWPVSQDVTLPCLPPQQKQGVFLSRASSISLTVEHALESFSFLNTSDMEDSEGSEEEPLQDERCTAGLAGRGAGQDAALGQLGMGDAQLFPGAQAPSQLRAGPGQEAAGSGPSGGTVLPRISPWGLGWEAAPMPLCPWDLVLHPALMP